MSNQLLTFLGAAVISAGALSAEPVERQLDNNIVLVSDQKGNELGRSVVKFSFGAGHGVEQEIESGIMEVVLEALFYEFDSALIHQLRALNLESNPSAYIDVTTFSSELTFELPLAAASDASEILVLMNQLLAQEDLSNEAISQAMNALGRYFTFDQVRSYQERYLRPEMLTLSLLGLEEGEKLVDDYFCWQSQREQAELPPVYREMEQQLRALKKEQGDFLTRSRIRTEEAMPQVGQDDVLIDGKLIARKPSWYQSQNTGYWLGGSLMVAGVIGGALLGLFVAPPLAFAGLIGLLSGSWFFSGDYSSDPAVIANWRQQDVVKSFYSVYKSGHTVITLTPAENRKIFIRSSLNSREMVRERRPIAYLATRYRLSDQTFAEMLTLDERISLATIRDAFIADKNFAAVGTSQLDAELQERMKSHDRELDRELRRLKDVYDENYYVRVESNARTLRDEGIQSVWDDFNADRISSDVRDQRIREWQRDYEGTTAGHDFEQGLSRAKQAYHNGKEQAEELHRQHEELIKRELHYEERMEAANQRLDDVYYRHDLLFRDFLYILEEELPEVVDFRDLR